jgi:hypothetical protein
VTDTNGRALTGVKVETAAHWDTPNYCGFLNGRDVLASGTTGSGGTLDIPDVDGQYAFVLGDDTMVFTDADNSFSAAGRQGLVASLSRPETTLQVHRFRRETLSLDILGDGKPVPEAVLWADRGLGVCGAGDAPIATADSRGHIQVKDFYREIWSTFWLCAGPKQAWVMPDDGRLPSKITVGVTRSAEPNQFADRCGK